MWCKQCNIETDADTCEQCGNKTEEDIPYEIYWCEDCKVPIIKAVNAIDKDVCPICGNNTTYMCADLRPVFPEERLLFEIISGKPLAYIDKSVWASNNRYYINGKAIAISSAWYRKLPPESIRIQLNEYQSQNNYDAFNRASKEQRAKFLRCLRRYRTTRENGALVLLYV